MLGRRSFVWVSLWSAIAVAQDAPTPPPAAEGDPAPAPAESRGLKKNEPDAFAGYTLLSPLSSKRTILLDMEGKIVHEWMGEHPPGNSVYLQDNGHLLRCRRITDGEIFEGGGIGGGIEEYDENGKIVWEYRLADEQRHHHHDIEPLPNGNILVIHWERKSGTKAAEAGRDKDRLVAGEFWPDAIFEIEKLPNNGSKVVWEWHVWDHLVQDYDADRANYGEVAAHPEKVDLNGERQEKPPAGPPPGAPVAAGDAAANPDAMRQAGYLGGAAKDAKGRNRNIRGADWLHTNGIDYNPALDQIIVSIHHFDEFWVIDHSTTTEEAKGNTGGRYGKGGDLLYRWGNPQSYDLGGPEDRVLFGQHDAQWIEPGYPGAGNILVFNNGAGREGEPFSAVDELAPPMDAKGGYVREAGKPFGPTELVWRYGGTEATDFYSSFISGAQRLKNGNTLICQGADGRVFEVTKDHRIVWEFWNDVGGDAPTDMGPHRDPPPDAAGAEGAKATNGAASDDAAKDGAPAVVDRRAPPGPGPRGLNKYALFRATRLAPDHPGIQAILSTKN